MEGTLETIAQELSKLLQPLKDDLNPKRARFLFSELGFALSEGQTTTLSTALNDTVRHTLNLLEDTKALIAAIEADNINDIVQKGIETVATSTQVIESFTGIKDGIDGLGLSGVTPQMIDEIPEKLFSYLFVRYLERLQGIIPVLSFMGVLEQVEQNIGSADPDKPPFTKSTFHLSKLGDWVNRPGEQLTSMYKWDDTSFSGVELFIKLEDILSRQGIPVIYDDSGPVPKLDLIFVEATPKTDINPKGVIFRLNHEWNTDFTISEDDYDLNFKMDFNPPIGTELLVQPNGISFTPPTNVEISGNASFDLVVKRKVNPTPYVILGEADASRLEVEELSLGAGARLVWETNAAKGVFSIESFIRGGKVVIDTSNGDGFINTILSGINIESDFEVGMGFTTNEGIFFHGSSTLEIQLPTHIDLGPIDIDALTFSVGISGSEFPIGISANIKAELGPLVAVVEGIGVLANFSIPANATDGNLGPLDLDIGFKPPNGVGLSVDAGVVKGGGYLFFDFDKGEYAGALELTFSEIVSLKAIGLITTKMPDGSNGFSLIIIITAEFGTGIQLGFGFTLLGVGGLLGLNRTMRLDALAEGVRTGATESIMFPTNVVENAPKIISDLRNFFPVEVGKFLIGPMAKLGWGTPTLISISLGIIIEIPGNIAILGIIKIALPTEEAALIVLQVNFIGAIEFDKDRLWFFASMYDSRVLFITLEGEMGLLVGWGSDSNFVSAVGGFHPAFNPPPLPFPNPVRISINILNESWGRIRVMGYFAVTSNTAQFGASAELYFGMSALKVEGHIGFDALFQFSPFYMIIQLSASLSVKVFGIGLFSVKIKMSLEGPSPWHAKGTGSISLLFFDIDVDFDFTWGEEKDTELPPISVMPLLVAEYEKQENWKALVPSQNSLFVSLREIDDLAELVLHPVGSLQVTQRAIPLELTLNKLGTQKPDDANHFTLAPADNALSKINDVKEKFAIAQFVDLKDAEKLSSPSYQPIEGGIELSVEGEQLATGKSVKRHIRYELITIDSNYKRGATLFFKFITSLFNTFLRGNAVARSAGSYANLKKVQPFDSKVKVQDPGYSAASMVDNTQFGGKSFGSQTQAMEFVKNQMSANPELEGALHVVPNHEINTAA